MNFLKIIAPQLTGAAILFDIVSHFGKLLVNQQFKASEMTQAKLKWAILDSHQFETWSPNILVEQSIPYFSQINTNGRYQLLTNISMKTNDFLKMSQIIKLKFV